MSDESMETNMDAPVESAGAPLSEPTEGVEPVVADTTQQPEPMGEQPMGEQPQSSDELFNAELVAARREAAEAKARADAYQDFLNNQMSQQQSAQQQEYERQRLEMMTPEELFEHKAQQAENKLNETIRNAEMRIREANDRAAFAALKASEPAAARLESEVEKYVADQASRGVPVDREVAYTWLMGQEARKSMVGKTDPQHRRQAQTNIQNSTTTPTHAGGDRSTERHADVDDKALRNERLMQGKRGSAYR
jgi:membrane-associated HD superfamily phosphohydrolase